LERAPDGFLRWAARSIPGNSRPIAILGERLLARGETRAALEILATAAAKGSQEMRLAIAFTDALRASGMHEQASLQARRLLEVDPSSGRLRRILGQCQLELGQLSQGLASLEEATRLNPQDVAAWIALAEAQIALDGFRPRTAAVWELGLRANPDADALKDGLAETYVALGLFADAEALVAALPQRSTPSGAKERELFARAWLARGATLRRLSPDESRLAQARLALDRSVALAPGHPEAHYELGLLLADEGEWDAARRSLENATRLRSYAHPFWHHLARVYRRLGRAREAEQAEARFDLLVNSFAAVNRESQFLDAHPQDVSRRLRLVHLLMRRHDADAAAMHLSLVLRDHPRHPEASRLLHQLRTRGVGVPSRGDRG
jgi:tetratricopeptide (TPR) repeat protein